MTEVASMRDYPALPIRTPQDAINVLEQMRNLRRPDIAFIEWIKRRLIRVESFLQGEIDALLPDIVSPGDYTAVTVNSKGLVTGGIPSTGPVNATSSVTMIPNRMHYANMTSQCVLTLPDTLTYNDGYQIIGANTGGWKVQQKAGQTIYLSGTQTTTGAGGSISSGLAYDNVVLRVLPDGVSLAATARNGSLVVV